jgi:hypothetical protein
VRTMRAAVVLGCFFAGAMPPKAEAAVSYSEVGAAWDLYVVWASVLQGVVRFEATTVSPNARETVTRITSNVYVDSRNSRMLIEGSPENGNAWVNAVNEEYRFSLLRTSSTHAWAVEEYSWPPKRSLMGALHTTCAGLVVARKWLPDMLASTSAVVSGLQPTVSNGSHVLLFDLGHMAVENGAKVTQAQLSLALDATPPYLPLEVTGTLFGPGGPSVVHVSNTYDSDSLSKPVIKEQRLEIRYPNAPGGEVRRIERRHISLAPLSRTAANQYRMSAFGIDEPPNRVSGGMRMVLVAINAGVIGLALVIWLTRWLRRRTFA